MPPTKFFCKAGEKGFLAAFRKKTVLIFNKWKESYYV